MKTLEISSSDIDIPDPRRFSDGSLEWVDPPYLDEGQTYADIPELPTTGRSPEQIAAYLGYLGSEAVEKEGGSYE